MEHYYLVHRVLSEKYGESHIRTIDYNDSVFEVLSGKCSALCEGVAVLKNDREHLGTDDDGWVPIRVVSVMENDADWRAFTLSTGLDIMVDNVNVSGQTVLPKMSSDFGGITSSFIRYLFQDRLPMLRSLFEFLQMNRVPVVILTRGYCEWVVNILE